MIFDDNSQHQMVNGSDHHAEEKFAVVMTGFFMCMKT